MTLGLYFWLAVENECMNELSDFIYDVEMYSGLNFLQPQMFALLSKGLRGIHSTSWFVMDSSFSLRFRPNTLKK